MAKLTPQQLINDNLTLVSLPEIVIRLNEMVDDPKCTAADIANTLGQDVALTGRLLKIVNSPFYGFPSKIDTISMAVTILGNQQLRDLVLSTSVITRFQKIPMDIVNMDTFWRHSISCATAAKVLATHLRVNNQERFFVAGLLHDIGKLIMYITLPDPSRQVIELGRDTSIDPKTLETSVFGFDHAELGAELLRTWQLPDSLITATAYHHNPSEAENYQKEVAVVHLANALANTVSPSFSVDDDTVIDPAAWSILGIDPEILAELTKEVNAQLENALQTIYYDQAA